MGFLNELAKAAGSALGYYVAGPTGAALGRAGTGMLTGEESSHALENALYTGLGTYGVQTGANALGDYTDTDWLSNLGGGSLTGGNILGLNLMGEGSGAQGNGIFSSTSTAATPATTASTAAPVATAPTSTANKSILGSLFSGGGVSGGLSSMIPYMIAAGLVSDTSQANTKKDEAENTTEALQQYLEDTTWNDTTREEYTKGVMGTYNDTIQGSNKRIASLGADSGRGGGYYGSATERANENARESVAKSLSQTYQPATTSPSVYTALAQAQSTGDTSIITQLLNSLGSTAGKWPYLALASAT